MTSTGAFGPSEMRIREALATAVERGEVGVQVAAYLGDELIVDEWIGVADSVGRPVDGDTLFPTFSTCKAFVATAVQLQAERGFLDLDQPIARYWPEYAANGKGEITLRHVLTHRGGVPQMPPELDAAGLQDWDAIVEYLASVEPLAPPGTVSQYHSLSFGFILGEVIRRTDPAHRPYGDFLRDELCAPLDIKDLWVGLPASEEQRVAELTWGAEPPTAPAVAPNPLYAMTMPPGLSSTPEHYNQPVMHQACSPASTGITTARAGARFFSLLANRGVAGGTRLISEDRLLSLTELRPNPHEVDLGIGMPTWLGVGGFWLGGEPPANPVIGTGRHILAHGGAGGSIGWADLDTGLAVMILHNRMFGSVERDAHPFVPLGDAVRVVAAERSP